MRIFRKKKCFERTWPAKLPIKPPSIRSEKQRVVLVFKYKIPMDIFCEFISLKPKLFSILSRSNHIYLPSNLFFFSIFGKKLFFFEKNHWSRIFLWKRILLGQRNYFFFLTVFCFYEKFLSAKSFLWWLSFKVTLDFQVTWCIWTSR